MKEKGYVQVYTGNGKGKTTAALGLTLRAIGAGFRVYLGQFIKGMRYSEIEALDMLGKAAGPGRLEVRQFGRGCFIYREPEQIDIELARSGLAEARQAMLSGEFDIIILDEINNSVQIGLIPETEVLALIAAKPACVELVLTGRNACPAVIAAADLVTEMREVKHYYQQNVQARKGIES